MKTRWVQSVFITAIVLFSLPMSGETAILTSDSKITAVTVYPGAARVTRQAVLQLEAGEHSIVFQGLVPNLDDNSLSISGEGAAKVKIFGAYTKREYLEEAADERVKTLQDKIEEIDDALHVHMKDIQILQEETEFLNSVKLFSGQQIPKDLVTTMPTTESLGGMLDFLRSNLKTIEGNKEDLRLKQRSLQREKEVLLRELGDLRNQGGKMQHMVVVDLACSKAGKFMLDISYLLHGANWRPLYDARAKVDKSEVELTQYSVVTQTTGEDWSDVKLTLSTAQPTLGGRMPYISPWVITPREEQLKKKMAWGRTTDASAPMMQMEAMSDLEETNADKYEAAEMEYSQIGQKGVSITYEIVRPASIKSDGAESKFPITTQLLKADFEYSTYPRARAYAYLGSRVSNADNLQLLAGQVNLFLDGDYVGKSSIDNIGPGEDFDLYLGVDENVKVEKREIEKNVDDVLIAGIPSPNKRITVTHKITVENYKNKKINVNLFDAIPVSENDRVRIKIGKVSVKPVDKDWRDRKGIWRWEFELSPKEKKEVEITFTVEHPRKMWVEGI